MSLELSPAPGAASPLRRWQAQLIHELALTLRNGEQLLLTMVIPVGILLLTAGAKILPSDDLKSVSYVLPGVIALAVMSTAFTGQAIATGFERRYGALERLGTTPLGRGGLIAAKIATVICVELIQVGVLSAVAVGMGWHRQGSLVEILLPLALATAAFSGLGLLMAGTLKAEITLAAANLVYLVLLFLGGLLFPLTSFPQELRTGIGYLPSAALADALRAVLQHGSTVSSHDLLVLLGWAVVAVAAAVRLFRWR